MEYVNLTNTDLKVSPICLGTWQFNDNQQSGDKTWEAQPIQLSKAILDKALELGVNFIDTAEIYLNSEKVLGQILEGRRQNIVLATKVGQRMPDYKAGDIEQSLNTSLQLLKTDYIDLYQLHYATFFDQHLDECVAELKRLQAMGRIRYYSVCNYGVNNLKKMIGAGGTPVANQLPYNLLWRSTEYDILPLCRSHQLSVLAYSPLQQGLLSGKFENVDQVPMGRRRGRLFSSQSCELSRHGTEGVEKQLFASLGRIRSACDEAGISMPQAALSWCLQNDCVKSVIVGASNPEQVDRNIKLVTLQQDLVQKLNAATDELREALGTNVDPWAPVDQSRIA